jgi:hypothetical protein
MLSISTQRTINEIVAQLERREDALQGIESTTIERELAYRRGEFVLKETCEEQSSLADEVRARAERRIEDLQGASVVEEPREEQCPPAEEEVSFFSDDPYEILTSSRYTLEELPTNERNEIRIRATPAEVEKFDFASFPENNFAFTITMSSVPARLFRIEIALVNMPWWFKWLLKSMEAETTFCYIRGVPVPKTRFLRLLSRGIGPLRLGMGGEAETRYIG